MFKAPHPFVEIARIYVRGKNPYTGAILIAYLATLKAVMIAAIAAPYVF